jgi:hypothetical protein
MLMALCYVLLFCGQHASAIVGGFAAEIDSAPWAVRGDNMWFNFGGGSIIAPNVVISAKHLIEINSTSLSYITAGSSCANPVTTEIIKVKEKIIHPTLDIVILKLEEPINLDSVTKKEIKYTYSPQLSEGQDLKTFGWGATEYVANPYNISFTQMMKIIGFQSQCIKGLHQKIQQALPTMIVTRGRLDSYNMQTVEGVNIGDSGSGLVMWDEQLQEYILLGVLQSGYINDDTTQINGHFQIIPIDWVIENVEFIDGPDVISPNDRQVKYILGNNRKTTAAWELTTTRNGNRDITQQENRFTIHWQEQVGVVPARVFINPPALVD